MRSLILSFFCLLSLPLAGQAQVPSGAPPAQFAFTHVTVIAMTGSPPRPDMTVVVTGNRISAVAPSGTLRVPRGAIVFDATGKYLIPGLWDMHVHAAWGPTLPTFGPLFLANGVTGVRDMWGRLDLVAGARIRFAQHRLTEPRFLAAGATLDGNPPLFERSIVLSSPDQARRTVDSMHTAGADFIKVLSVLSPEVYAAIMAEAKRLHMPVAGHVPITVGALAVSRAGQQSIEHLTDLLLSCSTEESALRAAQLAAVLPHPRDSLLKFTDHRQVPEILATYSRGKCEGLARLFRRDSTWQVPTLTVNRTVAFLADSADPRLQFVSPQMREAWLRDQPYFESVTAEEHAQSRQFFAKKLELVGLLHQAGVPLLAGTDALNPFCFPGFSLHEELALLVEAGLSPMDALRAATRNPAVFLRGLDSLGTIEAGKLADLVLLDADPIADIHNTTRISAVVLDGQLIDQTARQRLLDLVRLEVALPPVDLRPR
jgi:imidazolonepropionase-like amidohydrolase